jgi:photosystem II stability/assembly factor-like uncharacterized protein
MPTPLPASATPLRSPIVPLAATAGPPARENAASAVLASPAAEAAPASGSQPAATAPAPPTVASSPTVAPAQEDVQPTFPPDATGKLAKLPLQLAGEVVLTVGISPQYASDGTLLVATDAGALYRSVDAGANWARQPLAPVERLTFSPTYAADRTIVASFFETSEAADSKRSLRLYQSTDAGESWAPLAFPYQASPHSTHRVVMSTSYAQDRTIFVILHGVSDFSVDGYTFGWLYRSRDGGATWAEVPTPCQINVLVVSPAYAQDRTLYIGCLAGGRSSSNGLGLHRSIDGGATWTRLQEGAVSQLDLAPTLPEPTLFQGGARSTDGGVSWIQPRQEIGWVQELVISPAFAADRTLLALTAYGEDNRQQRIIRSVDGGDTWVVVASLDDKRTPGAPVSLAATLDAENRLVAILGVGNAVYRVLL